MKVPGNDISSTFVQRTWTRLFVTSEHCPGALPNTVMQGSATEAETDPPQS